MGVPNIVANNTIIRDPKIALAKPPMSACGGGVISVISDNDNPPKPRAIVSAKIQISQNTPNAMAASDSINAIALTLFRPACIRTRWAFAQFWASAL